MARATTRTWLALDEWARQAGVDPLHFNQLQTEGHRAFQCDRAILQNAWQGHVPSREDVADAIREAERRIGALLGYNLVPDWNEDRVDVAGPWNPFDVHATQFAFDGYGQRVKLPRGQWRSGGIRANTLLSAGATVVWPGPAETFATNRFATVTVALAEIIDPCQVRVYFQAADVDADIVGTADDRYEIRPVEASISGSTLTVRIRRELLVLPSISEEIDDPRVQSADENDTFVTNVDVYRVYNDPQTQVRLEWVPDIDGECGSADCVACTIRAQTGCLVSERPDEGVIFYAPAEWNATTEVFDQKSLAVCRGPDRLVTFTRTGFRTADSCPDRMDPDLARSVAMYAGSLLPRDLCDCDVNERIRLWRTDRTKTDPQISFNPSEDDRQNPLGVTYGAMMVWRRIRNEIAGSGALILR